MEAKFNFPFPPYSIQKQFMKELYFTIEENKLGIFESPTGTVSSRNYDRELSNINAVLSIQLFIY